MIKTLSPPPNLRLSECCGTCSNWEWEYEGEGHCNKYPHTEKRTNKPIWSATPMWLCDHFKKAK